MYNAREICCLPTIAIRFTCITSRFTFVIKVSNIYFEIIRPLVAVLDTQIEAPVNEWESTPPKHERCEVLLEIVKRVSGLVEEVAGVFSSVK